MSSNSTYPKRGSTDLSKTSHQNSVGNELQQDPSIATRRNLDPQYSRMNANATTNTEDVMISPYAKRQSFIPSYSPTTNDDIMMASLPISSKLNNNNNSQKDKQPVVNTSIPSIYNHKSSVQVAHTNNFNESPSTSTTSSVLSPPFSNNKYDTSSNAKSVTSSTDPLHHNNQFVEEHKLSTTSTTYGKVTGIPPQSSYTAGTSVSRSYNSANSTSSGSSTSSRNDGSGRLRSNRSISSSRFKKMSVTKTLTHLLSMPPNRSCADCKSTLIDTSQVYISISPMLSSQENVPKTSSLKYSKRRRSVSRAFHDHHAAFAPKSNTTSVALDLQETKGVPPDYDDPPVDPAIQASTYISGHGVFVCAMCGAVHKLLGPDIAVVNAAQDPVAWTNNDYLQILINSGGNARSSVVLEAYLSPQQSKFVRPTASSTIADRLTFIRAKYQALAFVVPPTTGPLAISAWQQIVRINYPTVWGREGWAESLAMSPITNFEFSIAESATTESYDSTVSPTGQKDSMTSTNSILGDSSFHNNNRNSTSVQGSHDASRLTRQRSSELPNRLVDHFCVVTASEYIDRQFLDEHKGKRMNKQPRSLEAVSLKPVVSDCYPSPGIYHEEHAEESLPEHVATFVFPEGCKPSKVQLPPTFFTFVLTNSFGDRLCGAVLQIYDDVYDIDWLRKVFLNPTNEWGKELPPWLSTDADAFGDLGLRSKHGVTSEENSEKSDVFFLPKCLVLLSHHPFFDLWRKFLLLLYRITLTESPLPIERFISNFICEVPLPPPGKVEIKFGFTLYDTWSIERPPENDLPLANFSFQPLFASLCVPNILIIIGCLLQETRVALVSKHYSILGPVGEALLSLLFPFHWQGLYLPILPYNMLGILEAPVPYLLGLHSRYLIDVPSSNRPKGVVFVDIDNDIVHLGNSDEDETVPRRPPCFPDRQIMKLRQRLLERTLSVYIRPDNKKIGSVTTGDDTKPLTSVDRKDNYFCLYMGTDYDTIDLGLRRRDVYASTDKAYNDNEMLTQISGFLSEQGQFSGRGDAFPRDKSSKKYSFMSRGKQISKRHFPTITDSPVADSNVINLLDMAESGGFSIIEIRQAFLGFFVSVFQKYKDYVDKDGFRTNDFLTTGISGITNNSMLFMESVVKTQMFQSFVDERRSCPDDTEVKFFDDSITAKHNRSTKKALSNISMGRTVKKQTNFLNDTAYRVTNTFTPPPPSNWGLPDDGRSYCYSTFPRLDPSLFGKIRYPIVEWEKPSPRNVVSLRMNRRDSVKFTHDDYLRKALKFPGSTTHAVIKKVSRVGSRNLESAIRALSTPFASPRGKSNKNDAMQKSRHHRKGSDESVFSDITLPSIFEFSPEVVSSAEEIVLNARRKQAILIGIMIKLQASSRRFLVRQIIAEQILIEARRKRRIASPSYQEAQKRKKAAIRIQAWIRAEMHRREFMRLRWDIVLVQKTMRGRRVKFSYKLIIGIFTRFQAAIRGRTVRRNVSKLVSDWVVMYRLIIFRLWNAMNAPLAYRTMFWRVIQSPSIFCLALAQGEVNRLWDILQSESPGKYQLVGNGEGSLNTFGLDISTTCFQKGRMLEELLFSGTLGEGNTKMKPPLKAGRGNASSMYVQAERLQIYEKLSDSHVPDKVLEEYYMTFCISCKEKHRKAALAEHIWCVEKEANASENFMLKLFPELQTTSSITFLIPSKKSMRRFPSADPAPKPLDSTMNVSTLVQDKMRGYLTLISSLSLRVVPTLMLRLTDKIEQERFWVNTYSRKLNAIMFVHHLKSKQEAGYLCINDLFRHKETIWNGSRNAARKPPAKPDRNRKDRSFNQFDDHPSAKSKDSFNPFDGNPSTKSSTPNNSELNSERAIPISLNGDSTNPFSSFDNDSDSHEEIVKRTYFNPFENENRDVSNITNPFEDEKEDLGVDVKSNQYSSCVTDSKHSNPFENEKDWDVEAESNQFSVTDSRHSNPFDES